MAKADPWMFEIWFYGLKNSIQIIWESITVNEWWWWWWQWKRQQHCYRRWNTCVKSVRMIMGPNVSQAWTFKMKMILTSAWLFFSPQIITEATLSVKFIFQSNLLDLGLFYCSIYRMAESQPAFVEKSDNQCARVWLTENEKPIDAINSSNCFEKLKWVCAFCSC